VNDFSLFPDLDGLSRFLRKRIKGGWGLSRSVSWRRLLPPPALTDLQRDGEALADGCLPFHRRQRLSRTSTVPASWARGPPGVASGAERVGLAGVLVLLEVDVRPSRPSNSQRCPVDAFSRRRSAIALPSTASTTLPLSAAVSVMAAPAMVVSRTRPLQLDPVALGEERAVDVGLARVGEAVVAHPVPSCCG